MSHEHRCGGDILTCEYLWIHVYIKPVVSRA